MQKGFKQVNLEGCVSGTLAVPVIGENGNWFIGNDDTGVYARGNGSGGDGTHYSTDEQVIGTWLDGSTLYRKTINFGALPNNTTKYVDPGITNMRVVHMYGTAVDSNNVTVPLIYSSPAALSNGMTLGMNANGLYITTGADRRTWTSYITLEYIKTSESV